MMRYHMFICKAGLRYSKRCGDLSVTVREKCRSAGGDEEWWAWEKAQVSHTEFQVLVGDDGRLEK